MTFRDNDFRDIHWCRWGVIAAFVVILAFQVSLAPAAISDCGEAEIPFPVQFTGADTPGSKAFLTKTIRKNVTDWEQANTGWFAGPQRSDAFQFAQQGIPL